MRGNFFGGGSGGFWLPLFAFWSLSGGRRVGGCGREVLSDWGWDGALGVLRLRPFRLACGSLRGFAQDDEVLGSGSDFQDGSGVDGRGGEAFGFADSFEEELGYVFDCDVFAGGFAWRAAEHALAEGTADGQEFF